MKKIALLTLAAALLLSTQATADSAQTSAVKQVRIVNFAFKPATLTVAKGTKVEFANTSGTTHTATRAKGFNSGPLAPGKTFAVRFKRAGSFAYHCNIHPEMRGKVVVQ